MISRFSCRKTTDLLPNPPRQILGKKQRTTYKSQEQPGANQEHPSKKQQQPRKSQEMPGKKQEDPSKSLGTTIVIKKIIQLCFLVYKS